MGMTFISPITESLSTADDDKFQAKAEVTEAVRSAVNEFKTAMQVQAQLGGAK